MQASAIFQRTESGRSEIKNKMHGLTQSERLALIVIDGVSTYGELRTKLKGLSEERFDRALTKLLQKSFVFEVLLDDGNGIAEEFDTKTIDNFLQQDPMDPVTIMSFDPEEEFDLDMSVESAATLQINGDSSNTKSASSLLVSAPLAPPIITHSSNADSGYSRTGGKSALKIASVDFYVPLESLARHVANVTPAARNTISESVKPPLPRGLMSLDESVLFATRPDRKMPWGLLLLLAGVVLIAVSIAVAYFR